MRKNLKYFTQKYIDWVIKLGRFKFSLLGILVLAIWAILTQILLSIFIIGEIHWEDLLRSISFGLISAPFVIYFFTLLVEKLELSRLHLAKSVEDLRSEIQERICAEQSLAKINRDKTTLMETISHELRTPLNGIIGLSRILLDDELSDKQRNYLKTINISAISLSHILSDIIDLEKIDGLRIELHPVESDLTLIINNMTNIGALMAEQKQLQFEVKCGQNLPRFLMLDSTRLNQVLWNLLSNAFKFTEKGKVILEIQRLSENNIAFIITDTGIGIHQAEIEKIFAMYYQVKSTKTAIGSGIGLAVSKNIAQLMGGDLTVDSEWGKGSRFILTINAQELGSSVIAPTNQMILDLNILLVEDIELNIVVAKAVLEKFGCHVDVAQTGKEAIQKFAQHYYDLIFLDIQLPDMSGFEVARFLRQGYEKGDYDYLPLLVALTANIIHCKAEYLKEGMDDVLHKPLSVKALNRCLAEHFSQELALKPDVNEEVVESAVDFELDFSRLHELIEMLGIQAVKESVHLFKQTMPEYVADLQLRLRHYLSDSRQKAELVAAAHKIKGAAGAVGLNRIQQIAQKAQREQRPEWEKHITEWVNEIATIWAGETDKLARWLQEQD